jgi:osmotically-inducible protein OsmY
VGTPDYLESVSEAEPYTPPTDPVVKPDRSTDGIEMLNGFAEAATDEAALEQLPGIPRGDDELREAVLAALHADAATTDLVIDVEAQDGLVTLRGTVPTLEDVDLAEAVAAEVPGVEEVQEELQVEGM